MFTLEYWYCLDQKPYICESGLNFIQILNKIKQGALSSDKIT